MTDTNTPTPGPVIVLVSADDSDKKPMLYACPKCGRAHSPKIYLARDDIAHAAAREAAANCYECREHNVCNGCGKECSKGWLKCEACRRAQAIEKADAVPVDQIEQCFGLDSGNYFYDPTDAAEAGEEYVFASKFRAYALDIDRVEEMILDEHHEDASVSDLVGYDELIAAIESFNAKQTSGSYDEDRSRIAALAKAKAVTP